MQKQIFFLIVLCLLGKSAAGQNSTTEGTIPAGQMYQQRNSLRVGPASQRYGGQIYIIDGQPLAPPEWQYDPGTATQPRSWLLDRSNGMGTLSAEMLEAMPVFNLNDQLSTLPGYYQRRAGEELNVAGARTDGNLYIIDGIRLR